MLLIGTSGYDYPEWKPAFYPETVKRANFLSYYATQFNSLELNGTYYKMPTPAQMQNMITRTAGKVQFTVKAFQDLTHAPDKSQYQPITAEFKKALAPLRADNLLLCTLLQFPESFHYEKDQYTDTELQEFIKPIKYFVQTAKIVQIFFNNHAKSQATINAKKLEILLNE